MNVDISQLHIPSFPSQVRKIVNMLQDSEADIGAMVSVLGADAGLTAAVLHCANSAAFRVGKPTHDLKTATLRLGLSGLMQVCITCSIEAAFPFKPVGFLTPHRFLQHGSFIGRASFEMAKAAGSPDPNLALTAGLVQDVGIAGLCTFYPEHMQNMTQLVLQYKQPFSEVETLMTGDTVIKFNELTKVILRAWDFPYSIEQIVTYPRNTMPSQLSTAKDYAIASLSLAGHLAYLVGMGLEPSDAITPHEPKSFLTFTEDLQFTSCAKAKQFVENLT